jgi:hypothetical protein
MEKKRNIRLLISLIVLMLGTVIVFFTFNTNEKQVVNKDIFRIADFTQVDKVVLTKGSDSIELKFDNSRWKVNGQLADRNMIDVLFATLQQAQPKRPVAEALQDSTASMLERNGVTVSLFAGDALQTKFLAGGNASKSQAYFKNPSEDESYIMVIPGYRVYASGIFELDENGWKDKYVFNFNWKNFQGLKATFVNSPKSDFEVSMGKVYFEVKGVAEVDTTRLNNFLDAVSLLTVDEYVNKEEVIGYQSLIEAPPILELHVQDVSGKTYSLALYESGNGTSVLGIIQGEQPAFFDRRKVTGILKNRNWFVRD